MNPSMYHLQLTLETPAENLALDEALLAAAAAGELPGEVLRLWESRQYCVVLGRSSAADREVRREACRADAVPLLRRPSGGATVVAGPGCLMYAVVLDLRRRPELRAVDRAHDFVLERCLAGLRDLAPTAVRAGTSDLAIAGGSGVEAPPRKFSGNSLRLARDHLLYHGTVLYDFQLERLERWLGPPARQPAYRQQRDHRSFVANLTAPRPAIVAGLLEAWNARQPLADWPRQRTAELAASRYAKLQE